MRIRLCAAGITLREQVDDAFPNRDRRSDGAAASAGHKAHSPKSDHNPNDQGVVRALDLDADFSSDKSAPFDFANQLRLLARHDKRISYIIYNGKIASWVGNYRWRKYRGLNPHKTHIHISFTAKGDDDRSMFRIPMLTGEPINGRTKKNRRKLGQVFSSSSPSNIPSGGLEAGNNFDKCVRCGCTCNNPVSKS